MRRGVLRILIYSMFFKPDLIGVGKYSGEMAQWLAEQGHEIRVITAPPFYPEWRIGDGYSGGLYHRENDHGMKVFRCPIWVPRQPSGLKRLLHLLSFALSSVPCLFVQGLWRPDVVWVVEPTFFSFPAALLMARLSGAKSWAHVQDLEIDAAFDLGILSPGPRRWVLIVEKFLMRRFDRVSTISGNMLARLRAKGVDASRSVLFPNWIDTNTIYPLAHPSPFRAELGIPDDKIVALYSGSMAAKQGFEILVEAIPCLSDHPELHFVLCGQGPSRAMLLKKFGSAANIHLLPLQPLDRLNDLLNLADLHLLPQRPDMADLVMPAKLLGMFASGRPVIATAQSGTQLAQAVNGRGIVVPPNDPAGVVSAVERLAGNPVLRRDLGANARRFAEADMNSASILPSFERDLIALHSSETCASPSVVHGDD